MKRDVDQPQSRRSRGRVLVVGAAPESLPPLQQPATFVENLFEAIGEVSTATAARPIALVLIGRGAIPRPIGEAVEALRRVDPAIPLVLLKHDDDGLALPLDASAFDDVVCLPRQTDRLHSMLGRHEPAPAPEEHAEDIPEPRSPRAPDTIDPTGADRDDVDSDDVDRDDAWHDAARHGETRDDPGAEFPPMPELPLPADLPELEPAPDGALGDVDLVAAVLDPARDVRRTALQLMAQQTAWTDVRLQDTIDAARTSAAIELGGRTIGWLVTASCEPDELEPWARWLTRWLALDHSYCHYRMLAYRDDLTGAWNRRFFNAFLEQTLRGARQMRRPITVMVFDIDDFKLYNDRFGHQAGDVILVETVRLLQSVIRQGDRVCRIGGDEFAVIFSDMEGPREVGSSHPSTPEEIAARFQDQISQTRFPKLGLEAPGNLSISAGLATYPWDGSTARDLLCCADGRALQSKRKGKNAITLGPDTESDSESEGR